MKLTCFIYHCLNYCGNRQFAELFILSFFLFSILPGCHKEEKTSEKRPNILLVISDDQSFPHASVYGYEAISTPGFDRIAREGLLFTNGFAASPGCSPSRAALLTGRNCWEIEAAGTHASSFPQKYKTYPELLEEAGYHVGSTGKGWGPGNFEISGRTKNPAGKAWKQIKMEAPEGISNIDYAANFEAFLNSKENNQPFCFWMGGQEPHRIFGKGLGVKNGKSLDKIVVPEFLPDREEVRSDIADYLFEIEWFDKHLSRAIQLLEEKGELENTLIIVTSDNGMAFPRAKANLYEYGFHVPLAIRWGNKIKKGRTSDDLIGFTDLAPTILEITGVNHPGEYPMSGQSILSILTSMENGVVDTEKEYIFSSRERHSSSRFHSLSYPQRCIRSRDFLYIKNFTPERWPAGAPQKYGVGNYPTKEEIQQNQLGSEHGSYHDIDACPTFDFMIENREDPDLRQYVGWAVDKRPAEELFDIKADPACLNNLANNPKYTKVKENLSRKLMDYLNQTGDPRVVGKGDIWETYPRFSPLREFPVPDWARENPDWVPKQEWLERYWGEFLAE
ncbi:MAG: sulfatase [Bacteroidia bacterium]